MAPTPPSVSRKVHRMWLLLLIIAGALATIAWSIFLAWAFGKMIYALF
jgi:hypothetical protein